MAWVQPAVAGAALQDELKKAKQSGVHAWQSGTLDEQNRGLEHGVAGLFARDLDVGRAVYDAYIEWRKNAAMGLGLKEPPPRRSIFGIPVLSPYHPVAAAWSAFMLLVDLVYTAFWVPLGVAFCTESFGDVSHSCSGVDLAGGAVYVVNVLMSFQSGVVLRSDYKRTQVVDGVKLAYMYIRHGRFWVDLLSVVPFIYLIVIICLPDVSAPHRQSSWVGILSLVRLVRLIRLISLSKVVISNTLWGRYQEVLARHLSVTGIYVMLLAYFMAVVINLEACIMLLIAHLEGVENSWLTSVSWEDFTTVGPAYQWYAAVYWVITTSTTTGYGDFVPHSAAEQVFANIYMIMGMVLFGLLVGTVANALTRASVTAAQLYQFRKKMSAVGSWLTKHHVPDKTQKQVKDYFSDVWVARNETSLDTEIFGELPTALREKVAQYITMDFVTRVHVLRDQEEGLQSLIASALRPVDITPGHDICRQGEEGDRIWICAGGELQALQHQADPCYPCTPCLLGESLLLGDEMPAFRCRPWTLRARGPLKLWEIKMRDLGPILRMYPRLRVDLLQYMQSQLLQELGSNVKRVGNHQQNSALNSSWCESVACMSAALLRQSGAVQEAAVQELKTASVEDGSLQILLDGLMAFSSARSQRVTLLQPEQLITGEEGNAQAQGITAQRVIRKTLSGKEEPSSHTQQDGSPQQPSTTADGNRSATQASLQQHNLAAQTFPYPTFLPSHTSAITSSSPFIASLNNTTNRNSVAGVEGNGRTTATSQPVASSTLLASMAMSLAHGAGYRSVTRPSVRLWAPGGASGHRPGISTVSMAGHLQHHNLVATSIPVANFGEGFSQWG